MSSIKQKRQFGIDSIPSEHGDHMLLLSITKKKRNPQLDEMENTHSDRSLITSPSPLNKQYRNEIKQMSQIKIKQKRKEFDFALNTQINCDGDISPGLILDS
jgi:hypothetical protein